MARALAVRIAVASLVAAGLFAAPSADAAKRRPRLAAFHSCTSLLRYARHEAVRVGQYGAVVPAPASGRPEPATGQPAPQDAAGGGSEAYSQTNVQEAGVDEPDTVKTNGRTLFALVDGTLRAIDLTGPAPRLVGSLALDNAWGSQLLLSGGRLLVLGGSGPIAYGGAGGGVGGGPVVADFPYYAPTARIDEVDVTDPSAMRLVRTLETDGSYVAARMHGTTARVVLSTPQQSVEVPPAPQDGSDTPKAAEARRRAAIRRAPVATWRPRYRLRHGGQTRTRALVRCTAIRRAPVYSGLNLLTVLTIDMDKGLPAVDSDAVMSDAQTVYASARSLYVASQRFSRAIANQDAEQVPDRVTTELHRFDAAHEGETSYRSSGEVEGFLLGQFSMSEQSGVLRVASTSEPSWSSQQSGERSESFVTTLDEQGSRLVVRGRAGGLGKGERIYAVRFLGDLGYVVTFRQVDPLYVVDVSDPDHPRVRGSLDLLGYSAYLHPVGDGRLLGVGRLADAQGRTEGVQVSLYDVSDPDRPRRLANHALGDGTYSDAEWDHHAFLWWPANRLAVIPVQAYKAGPDGQPASDSFVGAIGLRVTADSIAEAGRVQHPGNGDYRAAILRSLVAGGSLFTVSGTGVAASDLRSLQTTSWIPFG